MRSRVFSSSVFLMLLNRHRFNIVIVPDKRPDFFGVDLSFRLQPIGNALRFAVLKAAGKVVKNVVIGAKFAVDAFAVVIVSGVNVAIIEIKFAAGKRDVRDVFIRRF